jgi:hypothetical protein
LIELHFLLKLAVMPLNQLYFLMQWIELSFIVS